MEPHVSFSGVAYLKSQLPLTQCPTKDALALRLALLSRCRNAAVVAYLQQNNKPEPGLKCFQWVNDNPNPFCVDPTAG